MSQGAVKARRRLARDLSVVRRNRMSWRRPVLTGMAAGAAVAVLTLCFWEVVPRGTFARRLWDVLFYPEALAVHRVTERLSPHNADQGILYWLILHPLYCLIAGGLGGFALAWVWRIAHQARAS